MHIISKEPFEVAYIKYGRDSYAIVSTYRSLKENNFKNPDELKNLFPSLDKFKYREKWWVIDIGGNNLRLIVYINFINKRIYVKHIVTHSEYEKLNKYYRGNKE